MLWSPHSDLNRESQGLSLVSVPISLCGGPHTGNRTRKLAHLKGACLPFHYAGVPDGGVEPPSPCEHQHLKLACLPFHQSGVPRRGVEPLNSPV